MTVQILHKFFGWKIIQVSKHVHSRQRPPSISIQYFDLNYHIVKLS